MLRKMSGEETDRVTGVMDISQTDNTDKQIESNKSCTWYPANRLQIDYGYFMLWLSSHNKSILFI